MPLLVLIDRCPLCGRAADAGGHTPLPPAWMCRACGEPVGGLDEDLGCCCALGSAAAGTEVGSAAAGTEVASAARTGTSSRGDGDSLTFVSAGTAGRGGMTSEPGDSGEAPGRAGAMNS